MLEYQIPTFIILAEGRNSVMIKGFQTIDVFEKELDKIISAGK